MCAVGADNKSTILDSEMIGSLLQLRMWPWGGPINSYTSSFQFKCFTAPAIDVNR